jgi:hypothetical protein
MAQDHSSPSELPPGVTPDQLYDGADPNVVKFRPMPEPTAADLVKPSVMQAPAEPEVSPPFDVKQGYAATLSVALDILSARLLGLLAVIAACGIWSYAVWEPDLTRTVAATLFSVTVLGPLIALYWKAG